MIACFVQAGNTHTGLRYGVSGYQNALYRTNYYLLKA